MKEPSSNDLSSAVYFAEVKEIFSHKIYFCTPLEPYENGMALCCLDWIFIIEAKFFLIEYSLFWQNYFLWSCFYISFLCRTLLRMQEPRDRWFKASSYRCIWKRQSRFNIPFHIWQWIWWWKLWFYMIWALAIEDENCQGFIGLWALVKVDVPSKNLVIVSYLNLILFTWEVIFSDNVSLLCHAALCSRPVQVSRPC